MKEKEREELTNRFDEESNDRLNCAERGDNQLDRRFFDIIIAWKYLEEKLNLRKHHIDVIERALYRFSDFCCFLNCLTHTRKHKSSI